MKLERNIQKSRVRRLYYSQVYAGVDLSLMGKTVKMTAAEINNKGIRGYFTEGNKNYRCTVGKNKWNAKYNGTPLSEHLGREFDIIISQVNVTQDTLTVVLV